LEEFDILSIKSKIFLAIFLISVLVFTMAGPLYAAPSAYYRSKQAEFNKIKAQIDRIDAQLDVVVEQYNSEVVSLNKTRAEIRACAAKLKNTEKVMAQRKAILNKRVASVYRQGSFSYLEMILSTRSIDQFLYYLELINRQAQRDARLIDQYKKSIRDVQVQKAILQKKENAQRAIVNEIKAKKNKIAAELKERNKLLSKIKNEMAKYLAAERRRQARLRESLRVSYRLRSRVFVSRGSGRSGVVSLALNELGKPYVWGADGPDSFDCSGFTSYVYGQIGVSLPHSSRAQYDCGQHVSRDELQPGDLVFFARGGTISHVGIYIGGGNFIHAPRTGDVVKITSINEHGGYVGATRP